MEYSAFDLVSSSFSPDFLDEKTPFDLKENEILGHEKKSYFFDKEKTFISNLKEACPEMTINEKEPKKIEEKPTKVEEIVQTTFLNNYSLPVLLIIFDYFDPFSLNMIGSTCKYLRKISIHPHLYKKFCAVLFVNKNLQLPAESPFILLKNYISKNQMEFPPSIRLKAQHDIRKIVWGDNYSNAYLTKGDFYKQFKNWRNCFLEAPKIRLKGVYILKEKYLKIGEREFHQTYSPIHLCEYFRYLRFFEDGKCIMIITAQKLPDEKMIKMYKKYLNKPKLQHTSEILENKSEKKNKKEIRGTILEGEYIKKEGSVNLIFCQQGSFVFEYEVFIKSSSVGMSDLLFLQKKESRNLTSNLVHNENDVRAESVKIFFFKKVNEFGHDIKNLQLKSVIM